MEQSKSVLIMGGSGQAGSGAAAMLRRWYPELPLTIAGRDLDRAQRVADKLGAATAVTIDLQRRDLGLLAQDSYSAVVAAVWDSRLNGLHYAQHRGLPYLTITGGLVDIAPEVVAGARAGAAPILIAGHYMIGLVVLATLDAAREFERVDTIRIGAVLDELDAGGPSSTVDMERMFATMPGAQVRRDGVFTWVDAAEAQVEVPTVDGTMLPGQSLASLDVPSLALATGAPNVRIDFAVGESASRRRGEPLSTEVLIELDGVGPSGAPLSRRRHFVHPEGQQPLTGLGIALGVERLLGLRGEPVTPGVHTPESLIDPGYAVERMVQIGTTFH